MVFTIHVVQSIYYQILVSQTSDFLLFKVSFSRQHRDRPKLKSSHLWFLILKLNNEIVTMFVIHKIHNMIIASDSSQIN